MSAVPWYRDATARSFILRRYVPWLLGLNLAWEIVQLPLYTIWREGTALYIAYAVAHCTVGDVLIGSAALALALMATRAHSMAHWNWRGIAAITATASAAYTLVSEWLNTSLRQSWQYSELMPKLELPGLDIGAAPLAQWLIVPLAALYLARHASLSARRA